MFRAFVFFYGKFLIKCNSYSSQFVILDTAGHIFITEWISIFSKSVETVI